ncbi:MAG: glycosyltransferase family 4 protein [Rhodothermales bacterium]
MQPKALDNNMRLYIHDFGGYAFPFQLSTSLAERGHQVLHAYYGSHQTTPPGVNSEAGRDLPNLEIEPIELKEVLNKYNFLKRWRQESEYGYAVSKSVRAFKPDLVLSANTPLDAQKTLLKTCKKQGYPFVFWLQDLLGLASYNILSRKIPVAGALIGKHYISLEKKLLRQSHAIVGISELFIQFLRDATIQENKLWLQPNWAPLDQLPELSKENAWSRSQGLHDTFCFLYAGTLSMKHNPQLLVDLAQAFQQQPEIKIVVASNGLGASWLQDQKQALGLSNLLILPYQPIDTLPQVLATADVTLTLLEEAAGIYSVPSKVLTYMCAARPLLMAVPADNQASQMIKSNSAGLVCAPGNSDEFVAAARQLVDNASLRNEQGRQARRLAENRFDIDKITDFFEQVFEKACNR